uniref:TPX2 domain-containing protein n=1 Tax=Macrostomum lignano TaxID=282301 RepID=A0A1I8FGY1_9PLAT
LPAEKTHESARTRRSGSPFSATRTTSHCCHRRLKGAQRLLDGLTAAASRVGLIAERAKDSSRWPRTRLPRSTTETLLLAGGNHAYRCQRFLYLGGLVPDVADDLLLRLTCCTTTRPGPDVTDALERQLDAGYAAIAVRAAFGVGSGPGSRRRQRHALLERARLMRPSRPAARRASEARLPEAAARDQALENKRRNESVNEILKPPPQPLAREDQIESLQAYANAAELNSSNIQEEATSKKAANPFASESAAEKAACQQREAEEDIRRYKEERQRQLLEQNLEKKRMLQSYYPWGRPGHGAPIGSPDQQESLRKQKLQLSEADDSGRQDAFASGSHSGEKRGAGSESSRTRRPAAHPIRPADCSATGRSGSAVPRQRHRRRGWRCRPPGPRPCRDAALQAADRGQGYARDLDLHIQQQKQQRELERTFELQEELKLAAAACKRGYEPFVVQAPVRRARSATARIVAVGVRPATAKVSEETLARRARRRHEAAKFTRQELMENADSQISCLAARWASRPAIRDGGVLLISTLPSH